MSAVWPGLVTFMFLPVFWLRPIYFIPGYTWHMVHGNHEDGLSHVWGSPVAKDIQGMWGICLFFFFFFFCLGCYLRLSGSPVGRVWTMFGVCLRSGTSSPSEKC